ncbi:hypothetical protein ACF068_05630 [Streptomyces sp. NPDC016309]|uniref:hypothetical protein n=1 Tax=Streptomyces sp. NPDC016309 TaxID=3364965 RepID=UPI0036FDD8B4
MNLVHAVPTLMLAAAFLTLAAIIASLCSASGPRGRAGAGATDRRGAVPGGHRRDRPKAAGTGMRRPAGSGR